MRAPAALPACLLILAGCATTPWSTRVELRGPARARLGEMTTVYVASITCGLRPCPVLADFERVVVEEVKARGWHVAVATDRVTAQVMVLRVNIRSAEFRTREGGGRGWVRTGSRMDRYPSGQTRVSSTYQRQRVEGPVRVHRSVHFSVVIEDPTLAPDDEGRVLMRVHLNRRGSSIVDKAVVREAVRRALGRVPKPL